jgi:hypothetical protein
LEESLSFGGFDRSELIAPTFSGTTKRCQRRRGVDHESTRLQLHTDAEQLCVPEHALPQLPQFLGSDVVSTHVAPQHATAHGTPALHWPFGSQNCWALPEHFTAPGVQTPMHLPATQACETHGTGGGHMPRLLQTHAALPTHIDSPGGHSW